MAVCEGVCTSSRAIMGAEVQTGVTTSDAIPVVTVRIACYHPLYASFYFSFGTTHGKEFRA